VASLTRRASSPRTNSWAVSVTPSLADRLAVGQLPQPSSSSSADRSDRRCSWAAAHIGPRAGHNAGCDRQPFPLARAHQLRQVDRRRERRTHPLTANGRLAHIEGEEKKGGGKSSSRSRVCPIWMLPRLRVVAPSPPPPPPHPASQGTQPYQPAILPLLRQRPAEEYQEVHAVEQSVAAEEALIGRQGSTRRPLVARRLEWPAVQPALPRSFRSDILTDRACASAGLAR